MKITKKSLSSFISEIMQEQRDEPGLAHARSNLAYAGRDYSTKDLQRSFNKAERRQGRRKIRFELEDVDDDGDFDLINIGPAETKSEIRNILVNAGVLDPDDRDSMRGPEAFADPNVGKSVTPDHFEEFLSKLATDIAWGDESRLSDDEIRDLASLSPLFGDTLDNTGYEVSDALRRQEDYDSINIAESTEKKMSNSFSREDLKSWFAQTIYEDFENSKPRKRRSKDMLTEGMEDYTLPPLDQDEANRLAQAIVTGINLEFDINASGPALVDLEEQVQYHLAKHPGLPAILFDIAMEAVLDDDGDGVGPGPNYDSESSADGPLRAELIDIVAREIYDAMDSSSFSSDVLRDLVFDMIDANKIDSEDWDMANIDDEEIRDRVVEFEDENADFTGL